MRKVEFIMGEPEKQIEILFRIFDYDKSGDVEMEEFAQMMVHLPDDLAIVKVTTGATTPTGGVSYKSIIL